MSFNVLKLMKVSRNPIRIIMIKVCICVCNKVCRPWADTMFD